MKLCVKNKPGPKPKLSDANIDAICELISKSVTIADIAKQYKVGLATISALLTANSEKYARAREAEADRMAEEMLYIADNCSGDEQAARLQIDTRKWLASKKNHKKYGDRITQEVRGELSISTMTLEQVRAELAKLD